MSALWHQSKVPLKSQPPPPLASKGRHRIGAAQSAAVFGRFWGLLEVFVARRCCTRAALFGQSLWLARAASADVEALVAWSDICARRADRAAVSVGKASAIGISCAAGQRSFAAVNQTWLAVGCGLLTRTRAAAGCDRMLQVFDETGHDLWQCCCARCVLWLFSCGGIEAAGSDRPACAAYPAMRWRRSIAGSIRFC